MKIVSVYDGMSCGMIAMINAGVKIERYVACEIDKYCVKTSLHNFPTIEQKGDIFNVDFTEYKGFDFLIGGSPCTYWSIAQTKNRETVASGLGWELFCQYVRALKEVEPKYFIYENNKSMSEAIRKSISEAFGFEPICINSALVSAQNRNRLYWVGIRNEDGTYRKADIEQPEDKGVLLRDVLNGNVTTIKELSDKEMSYMVRETKDGRNHFDFCYFQDGNKDKSQCITANISKGVPYNVVAEPLSAMNYELESVTDKDSGIIAMLDMPGQHDQLRRVYGENGKAPTINTCQGGNRQPKVFTQLTDEIVIKGKTYQVYEVKDGLITVKGNQYPIKLKDGLYIIRKLTVNECKRLQTVPDWYEFPVSNTQAYKMLGNGWTCDIITYLIKSILD